MSVRENQCHLFDIYFEKKVDIFSTFENGIYLTPSGCHVFFHYVKIFTCIYFKTTFVLSKGSCHLLFHKKEIQRYMYINNYILLEQHFF